MIHLYTHGLCVPRNPGGALVWAWQAQRDGAALCYATGTLPAAPAHTNWIAAYAACVEALRRSRRHDAPLTVYSSMQGLVQFMADPFLYRGAEPTLLDDYKAALVTLVQARTAPLVWAWMRAADNPARMLAMQAYEGRDAG